MLSLLYCNSYIQVVHWYKSLKFLFCDLTEFSSSYTTFYVIQYNTKFQYEKYSNNENP